MDLEGGDLPANRELMKGYCRWLRGSFLFLQARLSKSTICPSRKFGRCPEGKTSIFRREEAERLSEPVHPCNAVRDSVRL